MTVWKWSQTAGNNDVPDSTINWRENQTPSTINTGTVKQSGGNGGAGRRC